MSDRSETTDLWETKAALAADRYQTRELLDAGWEPFAVSGVMMYFRRLRKYPLGHKGDAMTITRDLVGAERAGR